MSNPENLQQAQWAIDLLTDHHGIERSLVGKYGYEIWFTCAGFISACGVNWVRSRPLMAGLHHHIYATLFGFAVGRVCSLVDESRCAKRDAILVDYIKLHPERFPEKPVKKYADILQPWKPMR